MAHLVDLHLTGDLYLQARLRSQVHQECIKASVRMDVTYISQISGLVGAAAIMILLIELRS